MLPDPIKITPRFEKTGLPATNTSLISNTTSIHA